MKRTPNERIFAAVERLRGVVLSLTDGEGVDAGSVRLCCSVAGYLTLERRAQSRARLADWLQRRAMGVLAGRESVEEAFADCTLARGDAALALPLAVKVDNATCSVEQSIEVFRAALRLLAIAERDVRVTWDAAAGWARFRCKLPSEALVDKVSRNCTSVESNLRALSLWLRARAAGYATGAESLDLDRVFAGAIAPPKGGAA